MGKLTGLLLTVGLLLTTPTFGDEPMICEVGDYVQYRQELAREAHKLKELPPQTAKPVTPQPEGELPAKEATCSGGSCDLDYTSNQTLAGQTWGGRGTPGDNQFFGRSKKSDCGGPSPWRPRGWA